MKTLNITPGDSAGGSLMHALRDAGRDEDVLAFPDDLSCGPIRSDDSTQRAAWWATFWDWPEFEFKLRAFWTRVRETDDRLIVWFGRHYAREFILFLSWVDRLGTRPYLIMDVTGRCGRYVRADGSTAETQPTGISNMPPSAITALIGSERLPTPQERHDARSTWATLRAENAPLRVLVDTGLISCPIDYFDPLILAQATPQWKSAAFVVGNALGQSWHPYTQQSDLMLVPRLAALVESGRLLADGDPYDVQSCNVRLPG